MGLCPRARKTKKTTESKKMNACEIKTPEVREYVASLWDALHWAPPPDRISEWVDNFRILPMNTPFPGPWQNSRTPYAVEIMDNMSPHAPVIQQWIMKGAQIGLTAAAENVIGFWMKENPSEVMLVTASEDLMKKWATKRLEPLIDSIGMRERIGHTSASKTRRTGDTTFQKEYPGGTLDIASAQAASSLRSDSKRVIILDEIDGAPVNLRTGEGNFVKVAVVRSNAWGSRKKIMGFSTPTTFTDSQIWQYYQAGDQRKFLVPCPLCGKYQELERNPAGNHGLRAETSAGKLVQAYYLCEHCHDAIFNHHKSRMLQGGRWEPTVESQHNAYRSYHINSLYSPTGMLSWTELYDKYLEAQNDPEGMRSFVNLYDGLPYREEGARPSLEKVINLRGGYETREVPYGVLFLTIGIDVQRGSETDEKYPPRLEAQIVGHGAGYRQWVIDYQVFTGPVTDPYAGAWELLNEWATNTGLKYSRRDGQEFVPQIVFVDAGDGTMSTAVEVFCERWANTYPIKGFQALKRKKGESPELDTPNAQDIKRYRMQQVGNGAAYYYYISTNRYKTLIYSRLNIQRNPVDPQPPGFIDFPRDMGGEYFKQLTAEEKLADGTFDAGARRNEALDTLVYAMCAADVFLDSETSRIVQHLRKKYPRNQYAPEDIKKLVLQRLSESVGVEFPYGQPEYPRKK